MTDLFKPLLLKLVNDSRAFDENDTEQAIDLITSSPGVAPAQIGAFLTALKLSGLDRTSFVLSSAANAMMRHAIPAPVERRDELFVDIVGTGGDGHNTFNVSTSAAIVAAGAGARVVKHGNVSSTSSSGSADILRALGCTLPPPTPGDIIPAAPFTFLLASHYHPAMAALGPTRRTLPFRTLFNVLGPLINPARPHAMILGVAEPGLGRVFAEALRRTGVQKALVVCGYENLDEISIAGPTHIWSLSEVGEITEGVLEPATFGISAHALSDVKGASPQQNASVLRALLAPATNEPLPISPTSFEAIRDYVLINASALLVVAGVAESYLEGVELARISIASGSAWAALQTFKSAQQ